MPFPRDSRDVCGTGAIVQLAAADEMAPPIMHLLRTFVVLPHPSLFVVSIVCLAEILSMTPFSMFVALQPQLQGAWRLSNTESGWISSAYFTGYMLAVPVLGSLTDRIDARRVWLAACALAGAGSLGFATLAADAWTAAAFQLVTGAGLAGTYMPGLKVITDRVAAIPPPRHVAFYTTSFTVGSSLSFWIIGQLDAVFSWRTAVSVSAAGPLIGCALMYLALRPVPVPSREAVHSGAHIASVLRSADSMRYVIGYAAHVWELFALRAWVVPFVAFCQTLRDDASPVSFATLAALVSLVGVPASLAGAELSTRVQRRRLIAGVMLAISRRLRLQCPHQRRFGGTDVGHRRGCTARQPWHGDGDVLDGGIRRGERRHIRGGVHPRRARWSVGDELDSRFCCHDLAESRRSVRARALARGGG